jgi:mRNA interferase MazF
MGKAAKKVGLPRRGEVYLVNLDPTIGAQIKTIRPAVVLQNDVANRWSPITVVAPLTSQFDEPPYPTEVLVRAPEGGLSTDSAVLLNQIRSVDKGRLIRHLGSLKPETMREIERALLVSLGLIEP